jgi:hypothetical protein
MTITVAPGNARNTHHVKLTRSGTSVGLILCNSRAEPDESAIHMDPYPSQAIQMFTGEQKFTDKVPPYKPLAQMDWSGGMGSEYFEDDATRFYHAYNANTTKRGKVMLGGLPTYATGYRNQDMFMPGNEVAVNTLYSWGALYGTTRFRASKFTASAWYTANKIEVIIRKVGTPTAAATVHVYSDVSNHPGSILFYGYITTSMITDILSELMATDSLAGSMTIAGGTAYWVVVCGGAGDDAANHWEVVTDSMADGKSSADGTSWSTNDKLYFRVTDLDSPFIALFHEYKGQLYFATSPDDDSAGKLYMNGFRGVALSNAGYLGRLLDSTQTTWSDTILKNGVAALYDGQGVTEDQPWRKIFAGWSTIAYVTPDWKIVHCGSGSDITQYNILGLNSFQLVRTGTYAFKDATVTGEMGWICSGEDKQGRRKLYKYNEYTDGVSWLKRWTAENLIQASFIKGRLDPVLGYILYLARNNDTDKDVCVARALAPTNFAQQLIVGMGYHSASPNGFMTEKQTTVTDTASDSFNRADGELAGSATDGAGHPGHTGGSGKTWTARVGDVHVISNKAKPNSLTGGVATITYDCGAGILDVIQASRLYLSGGAAGIIVRFKDNDNFVYAYHTSTNVRLYKRVATVETLLLDVAATYVDGAEIIILVQGTRFKLLYNYAYIGYALINDADLQTGTSCGLIFTSTGSSIDNCWTTVADVTVAITGTNQAQIGAGPDFTTGLLCTDTVAGEDWRRYTRIIMAIKSTKAMASGELQLKIDDTALCASPIASMDFPLLLADYTYSWDLLSSMTFDLSATAGGDTVRSVGLYLTVNPTIYFDIDVQFFFVDTEGKIIPIGDKSDKIKSLLMYGDPETPWVLKEGGIWEITNDTAHQVRVTGMEAIKSSDNGKAAVIHDVYLFFALGQSYERYFRQTVDDVGPNKDAGLPVLYQGNIVHAVDYPSGVICAVDGGDGGYSSVVFYNESGWHCIYRAPRIGLRIRRLYLQAIPGNPPVQRLWISQGADVLWVPISLNPVNDSSYCFIWEGVVTTSYFSSGMLDVNKFYKSLKLKAKNLSAAGCTILAQYRADENTTWISLPTAFDTSPGQEKDMTADYSLTGKQLQMRLILRTSDTTKTPTILASVLNAFVIDPVKFTYTMNFRAADRDVDLNGDFDPVGAKVKIDQLNAWIADGKPLTMNSGSDLYDNKILFPLRQPVKTLEIIKEEGGREVHICQIMLLET